MSFYYFTSSDSGAPALSGTNGTFVTLLDWILVTKGGWTQVYSGTNKAVYRAPSGNRFYLRVVHDSAVSGSAQRATVRGYESMSGIDTGTDPFPTVAQQSDANSNWSASQSANSTARAYFGLVTDTFVELFVQAASTNGTKYYFFGDVAAAIDTDAWATAICVQGSASTSIDGSPGMQSASNVYYWARSIDGSVKSSKGVLQIPGGFGLLGNISAAAAPCAAYPHAYDTKLHHAAVPLGCNANAASSIGTLAMPARGWIPNLRQPLHSTGTVTTGDTLTDSSYDASAVFVLASASAGAGAFCLLEKTDTWSPPSG